MRTILIEILKVTEKSIDWVSKNLSRIKTLGLIALLTLFMISFVSNGCNREQAGRLIQQITGLDLQITVKELQNRTLQDSLNKEIALRLELERSKAFLVKDKQVLIGDNKDLRKRLAGIPSWLLNMPADSSYKFLNEIAYPFPGEKKFPFNEPQVKNMHRDYLENVELTGLVITLESQLINCEMLGSNADSLAFSFQKSFRMAEKKNENLTGVVIVTQEKADLYKKELDKNKRGKGFWRITTAIGSVIILILAL